MRRTECLSCARDGVRTKLVVTERGNCCPIHDASFLAGREARARAILGLTGPKVPDGKRRRG